MYWIYQICAIRLSLSGGVGTGVGTIVGGTFLLASRWHKVNSFVMIDDAFRDLGW